MSEVLQGLGLADEALSILRSFGLEKELDKVSLPMPVEVCRAVAPDQIRELYRDCQYHHRR
jgi:hypothetical protein